MDSLLLKRLTFILYALVISTLLWITGAITNIYISTKNVKLEHDLVKSNQLVILNTQNKIINYQTWIISNQMYLNTQSVNQ